VVGVYKYIYIYIWLMAVATEEKCALREEGEPNCKHRHQVYTGCDLPEHFPVNALLRRVGPAYKHNGANFAVLRADRQANL
jgi:hypothetical protein